MGDKKGILTRDEFAKILYDDAMSFWENVEKQCKEFEEKEIPLIMANFLLENGED
ncbi:hypothetical protein [Christiangramia crocea]|uniref:Uncharacterized protein n=1 Tax=Christiangramia crocea TaxID=2904124 RepID=A0A9X1UVH4_9FLAO|nr:hypothetical protein [Gramella crocea]MCG9971003.1 hypothetical protein [Gramella crocea]